MGNFLTEKGNLELSVGEGYLSAYEVSILKPGDIVKTEKLAGEGYSVFFNGHHIFTGEVVIIDHFFGFRITTFAPPKPGGATHNNVDDALEMLPFTIRLGHIDISLLELQSAGPGTIVSLDAEFSTVADAELLIAGIPVAKGKVGATYENMHLRIIDVYGNQPVGHNLEVCSTGSVLESEYSTKYSKDYNFKRPDKFSRNAIDRMKSLHELFARNVRMKYDVIKDFTIEVDQLAFGELLSTVEAEKYRYMLIQNLPWPRNIRPANNIGKMMPSIPRKFYIEPENANFNAPEDTRNHIKSIATDENYSYLNGVFILISKKKPIVQLSEDPDKEQFTVSALRGAWKNLVDLNYQLSESTDSPDSIKVIQDNEMIILVTIKDAMSDANHMHVVYPYVTLQPYIGILN